MLFFFLFFWGCLSTKIDLEDKSIRATDIDGDGFEVGDDCDDENPLVSPNALEICDGIDNNCDGVVDEGVRSIFYADTDDDGFGDEDKPLEACEAPDGYVVIGTDCDDTESSVYPSAIELCDKIDNNCDGVVDEGPALPHDRHGHQDHARVPCE